MNAVYQPTALDDFLRLFQGWQGTLFLFLCLLVIAMVLAELMSTQPYVIVVHNPDDDLDDFEEQRDVALRPFHLPAAKGVSRDRLGNLIQLGDRRSAR